MSRFAFDVNVAFLNAESTEEERIPARMPEDAVSTVPRLAKSYYMAC